MTPTPKPTDTPEPEPTPVIAYFSADQTTINAGEAVTLSWDLSGAEAVYLRYEGQSEGVVAPGSKTMTPVQTTVYRLAARNKVGYETVAELTVMVNAAAAPAPASSQPTNQPISVQPTAQLPSQSASQITEPVPQPPPLISFNSASPVLPLGACTNLSWSVQQAEAVYLDGVEVEPESSRQVCPDQPQTYSLKALYAGGERTAQVRLEVVEAIAAAVPTPTAAITELAASPTLPQLAPPTLAATAVKPPAL